MFEHQTGDQTDTIMFVQPLGPFSPLHIRDKATRL